MPLAARREKRGNLDGAVEFPARDVRGASRQRRLSRARVLLPACNGHHTNLTNFIGLVERTPIEATPLSEEHTKLLVREATDVYVGSVPIPQFIRGSGCLGAAAPVTGAAADEYNLNVVDCNASVTVARRSSMSVSGDIHLWPRARVV